jgi:hypothetical protein
MMKEGMIPCGLNERPLKAVRRVGIGDKMVWPMAFQHTNEIMHVKAPSSTTMRKMFWVKYFFV